MFSLAVMDLLLFLRLAFAILVNSPVSSTHTTVFDTYIIILYIRLTIGPAISIALSYLLKTGNKLTLFRLLKHHHSHREKYLVHFINL